MSRDPQLYLQDILEAINAIERYTEGITEHLFSKNELVQDGVLRRLEVIGEATRQLPKDIKEQYPAIPWRRITGMRNRLTHEYFGVLLDRVWNVVTKDLPVLKTQIEEVRKDLG